MSTEETIRSDAPSAPATELMRTDEVTRQPVPAHRTRLPGSPPDASTLGPGLRLLGPSVKTDVYLLYGVLRTLDDLVDEDQPSAPDRVESVERWARGEDADSPETRVLSDLCIRTDLSRQPLATFCEGMRHDIARRALETEDDLEIYCERAGGSVGIMLAQLLGMTDIACEEKMAALGRAMQRTNIIRDIDEDAAHGRTYIARSTIERFGAPIAGAREQLVRDQIARADELFEDARGALPLLRHGRRGMTLCTVLYREILGQIERDGFGREPGRVVVPAWRRCMIIARHVLSPLPTALPPRKPHWI
jgi:phytoene/squalene synthetase